MTFFCIEILGESAFHKFLVQSGWSGKDYVFHFNRPTQSHMRAYRCIEEYYAERVDLHKSANIWPVLGNLLTAEKVEPHVFVDACGKPAGSVPAPARNPAAAVARKGGRCVKKKGLVSPKNETEPHLSSPAPASASTGAVTKDSEAPLL